MSNAEQALVGLALGIFLSAVIVIATYLIHRHSSEARSVRLKTERTYEEKKLHQCPKHGWEFVLIVRGERLPPIRYCLKCTAEIVKLAGGYAEEEATEGPAEPEPIEKHYRPLQWKV